MSETKDAARKVSLEIDGQAVEADEDMTVLEAAALAGIDIPTLCYHKGLAPYGACRVCIVEVESRGRARVESACTRPVADGMTVRTASEEILEYRRMTVELLLAQCPEAEKVVQLARELGIGKPRFASREMECILCGLCTRACQDKLGTSAISFVERGLDRKVTTPFSIQSEECIGCGSCANVCPTGCIRVEDVGDRRYLRFFHTELELERCPDCSAYFAPRRMLERLRGDLPIPEELLGLCPDCRRQRMGSALLAALR